MPIESFYICSSLLFLCKLKREKARNILDAGRISSFKGKQGGDCFFFFLRICLFIIYFSEPGTCAGGFPALFTINISYKQTNKLFHHHNALAKVVDLTTAEGKHRKQVE